MFLNLKAIGECNTKYLDIDIRALEKIRRTT